MRPIARERARARAATTLGLLALLMVLAAVWSPLGAWWQWLVSAVVVGVIGAGIAGHSPSTGQGQR